MNDTNYYIVKKERALVLYNRSRENKSDLQAFKASMVYLIDMPFIDESLASICQYIFCLLHLHILSRLPMVKLAVIPGIQLGELKTLLGRHFK